MVEKGREGYNQERAEYEIILHFKSENCALKYLKPGFSELIGLTSTKGTTAFSLENIKRQ